MLKIDIYKNGEFTRIENVVSVIFPKSKTLEIIKSDGSTDYYFPSEYDWFNVL